MILTLLLSLLGLPLLLASGYLLLLTLLSAPLRAPAQATSCPRFVVLVPAHNEKIGIAATIENLLQLDWPRNAFRITVIADNCSDDTAVRARAAGAEVLERNSASERGKGYALQFAYERLLQEGWADAVVVVDADTRVSSNLLAAYAGRIEAGAPAAQAFYGVLNPDASWRTRLMAIALGAFHRLRGRARERLGVSSILRGNGMCFTAQTLRDQPHHAFSLVEDLEYTLQLGNAGLRIAYVDEASVMAEMVSTAQSSESQRERWEGGRAEMVARYGLPLLRRALRQRDGLLLDLSLDVLVPPLAQLVAAVGGYSLLSLVLVCWFGATYGLVPAALMLVALVLYVLRGASLSGLGVSAFSTLALAPAYVAWKLGLKISGRLRGGQDWKRTTREDEAP